MADRLDLQISTVHGANSIACMVDGEPVDVTDPATAAVIWRLSLNAADYVRQYVGDDQMRIIAESLAPPWQSKRKPAKASAPAEPVDAVAAFRAMAEGPV